jgi:RNA recognition motif-containing protein
LPQHTRFTSTEENIRLYKQKNYQDASVDDQRNIYVCRLNKKTDEEQLKQLVQRCGEVESVKIIYEQENSKQKSKGYGFILFKTNEAAAKAVTFLRSEGFGASFAKPSLSLKLKELHDNNSTNLYFANLPLFWEERELLQLMEQKGFNDDQIQSIRVMRKKYMDCSFGFVKLESRSTAEEVIKALNGSMLKENGRALGVRFADTFEQKKLKTTIRQRSSSSAASVSE